MKEVKARINLKEAESAVAPKVVFFAKVNILDNGKLIVEHPDLVPGQEKQQVAMIINLLADGIKTMAVEHYIKQKSRLIVPV